MSTELSRLERIDSIRDRPPLADAVADAGRGGAGRLELHAPADRCDAGHHQRPGAGEHRGARLFAARSRAARHVRRSRPRSPALPRLDYTRSLSRYGLSQVTVVFEDGTDIYFARQQVAERIAQVKSQLPAGLEPELGPIATGMGEIFLYTVTADPAARRPDGNAVDRDGPAFAARLGGAAAAAQHARASPRSTPSAATCGRSTSRRIPRGCWRTASRWTTWSRRCPRTTRTSARATSSATASSCWCASRTRRTISRRWKTIVLDRRDGVPIRIRDVATVGEGRSCAPAPPRRTAQEVVLGTVFMLIGENSRAVARAAAAQGRGNPEEPAERRVASRRSTTAPAWSIAPSPPCARISSKARCWSSPCCSCCSAICAPR